MSERTHHSTRKQHHEKDTRRYMSLPPNHASPRPLHVVFVHLDLGIGGAEQLVLQLASASVQAGHKVDLVTTRCDAHHCFAAVHPDTGHLHKHLHVWGRWIPTHLFGNRGKALCSHVRLAYLAWRVTRKKAPDLIVVDVLPTPLPLLRWTDAALLFYCHFPDLLLTQQQQQQQQSSSDKNQEEKSEEKVVVHKRKKSLYRKLMDGLETACMTSADLVVCNSQFTKSVMLQTFPSLLQRNETLNDDDNSEDDDDDDDLPVLYPTLEQIPPLRDLTSTVSASSSNNNTTQQERPIILSLNRYERKKNLELVLEAAAWVQTHETSLFARVQPRIIIAGGYDVHNLENVQYRAQLETTAQTLGLQDRVTFLQSISDADRSNLLAKALCVLYTPANEHFGIVPLESMAAGTPVVACRSGGPLETIRDGVTGFLCDPTPASFGAALVTLLRQPDDTTAAMGRAARQHVVDRFGPDRLQDEWCDLVEDAVQRGRRRLATARQYRWARTLLYGMEAVATLLLCLLLTALLRWLGVLLLGLDQAWLWKGLERLLLGPIVTQQEAEL